MYEPIAACFIVLYFCMHRVCQCLINEHTTEPTRGGGYAGLVAPVSLSLSLNRITHANVLKSFLVKSCRIMEHRPIVMGRGRLKFNRSHRKHTRSHRISHHIASLCQF